MEDNQDLASFFARPIYGVLTTWTPGSNVYGTFNPWNVFFNNKRVSNRLSNFKLASAKLHVKIMINGSPFHYGRMLIAYIPLHTYDTCTLYPPTVDQQYLWPIVASQRMKLFVDPSEGKGGELVLPFVWPYDSLDLANGDFNNLGTLVYCDMNTLKHANAATTAIQVTYAIWAEDVNMAVPTTVNISGLVTQSSETFTTPPRPTIEIPSVASPKAGHDVIVNCTCCAFGKRRGKAEQLPFTHQAREEYADGPISKTASAVARAAGMLNTVPGIGTFSRAAEIGASAVSGIAKIFGYSKPVDLAHPTARMTPRYISELAITDGLDPAAKLTVDSKQELSIDPKIFGINSEDEMSLTTIAAKESFITQFAWTTAKVSGDLLFNCRVNPFLGTTSTYRFSPACEFASIPFNYWRGHMAFRIQVVASRQHRGRLAIVWDPNYVKALETNIAHTVFVDLDEQRDVVVKLPWGQRASYMMTPSNVSLSSNYGTTAINTSDLSYSNGVLAIYCINELAVPNSVVNSDIQVNVYACLCDADYGAPNNKATNISFINQASEEFTDESQNDECAADGTLVAPAVKDENMSLIYFGEKITSFRQMIKRYTLVYTDVFTGSGYTATKSNFVGSTIRPKFPPFRGVYSGATSNALHVTGTTYENRVLQHMISYVAAAFACCRGSVRVKHIVKPSSTAGFRCMRTYRTPFYGSILMGSAPIDDTTISSATSPTVSYLSTANFTENSLDAAGVAVTMVNPVMEVEFPYYFSRRFDTPRDTNSTTSFGPTNVNNGTYEASFRTYVEYKASAATDLCLLDTYAAAGEDFTCVWFQGMPPWKIYT